MVFYLLYCILYIVLLYIIYSIFYITYYISYIIYYILYIYIYIIYYMYILYIYTLYIYIYYITLYYDTFYYIITTQKCSAKLPGEGFFQVRPAANFARIFGPSEAWNPSHLWGKPWENMGKPEKRWRNLWGNHGKRWGKVGKMPRSWEIYSKKNSNLRGNLRNIGKMAQPENFLVNNLIEMPKSWKPEKYGEHIIELASWKHTFRFLSFWRLFYVHIGNALWKSHP